MNDSRRMIILQGVIQNCLSLKELEYKIQERNFSTNNPITDLDALTNYTVTIRATNNKNLSSDISITVMTGELGK